MENSFVICTSCSASRKQKGGRVVEGAPLERVYAGNRIESSNLSLSAMSITKIGLILEDLVVSVAFPFNIEFDRLLLSQEFKTTKESTMKKKIQGVFFCLLMSLFVVGCSTDGFTEIIITNDDKILHQILNKADENTLVVFDCDEVLITPTDTLFSPANESNYKKTIKYLTQKMNPSEADDVLIDLRKQYKFVLVDEKLPDIIKNLQKNGTKVLVLTAHWTGKFHGIEQVEDLRKNELASFDFDFKKSWNDIDKIVFHELPATLPVHNLIRYPIFEDGIIFSCNLEKGVVLQKFFNRIPQKFDKIIFVDDKMKNIKSIEKFCKTNGVRGYCVQYKKAEAYNKDAANPRELEQQLDTVISVYKAKS